MRAAAIALGLALLGLLTPVPGQGQVVLLDFEQPDDLGRWHDERQAAVGGGKTLEAAERFAAAGTHALRFRTPAWRPAEHGGASQWPAVECTPPVTDWSRFDRLVFEVVNATAAPQRLALFISDSRLPTRQGLQHRVDLPPQGYAQVVVPIRAGLAEKKVDPADVHVIHLFTTDPPVDLDVYVDRWLLLEPGQAAPPLPTAFLRDFAAVQATAVQGTRDALAAATARLRQALADSPAAQAWTTAETAALQTQLTTLEGRLAQAEPSVLAAAADLAALREAAARLEALAPLRAEYGRLPPAVRPPTGEGVVVALASSMEKVLPRGVVPRVRVAGEITLGLARNEKESVQVIVLPLDGDLKQVRVRAEDLRSPDGHALAAACVATPPVGYVQTRRAPPYGSSHIGWWPDPILEFLPAADIAKGDAQAFWVRVRAPRDQAPGRYSGRLLVEAGGDTALATLDLSVQVYGFTLPDTSALPLAITFSPHDHPLPETKAEQAEWAKSPDYPVNAWKRHRERWAEFLADYDLTYDSLYHRGTPDFEILARLHEQGRLGRFNLGYYGKASNEEANRWGLADTLKRLRDNYDRAQQLGILDHAYIYGCDENPKETFPQVEKAAALIRAELPGVTVMTTTYDNSYGQDSVIKSVDAWCPLTPRFDPAKAAAARAAGKQVWWYICCGPHHPHANTFIEYPAIEARLLMGAMAAKYRPDGFLYYQISIWNSRQPITSGPFTDWDPRSWTTYHGDGAWTCVGPDGTPLATVRLENVRDGLEDYAYAVALEARIREVRARGDAATAAERAWLAEAEAALTVPETLVKSLTEYSRESAALYAWRDRLADLIARPR